MVRIVSLSETTIETALSATTKVLKEGGIVAIPTDTLYGLVCTVNNAHKLYAVKRRSYLKPCGLFIAGVADLRKWCCTTLDDYVLKRLLPGPVTLLFQRSHNLPLEFNPGFSTVGIRVPRNELVSGLTARMGPAEPLVQTSANLSENISPGCIEDFRDLWDGIDLIIDGGRILDCDGNISRKGSTVVNLTIPGTYSIIRDGSARVNTEASLRDCGLVAITDGDLIGQLSNNLRER